MTISCVYVKGSKLAIWPSPHVEISMFLKDTTGHNCVHIIKKIYPVLPTTLLQMKWILRGRAVLVSEHWVRGAGASNRVRHAWLGAG